MEGVPLAPMPPAKKEESIIIFSVSSFELSILSYIELTPDSLIA